jgi:hypothetical protein
MTQPRIFAVFAVSLFVSTSACSTGPRPSSGQSTFASPQEAVTALLKAAADADTATLEKIFGSEGKELVHSGDPVQDKNYLLTFAERAREANRAETDPENPGRSTLIIGKDNWPFPTPIVKAGDVWFFDSKAGLDEVLTRRIGANELDAIEICHGFVEAQREYAILSRLFTGVTQYAQRIFSSPGKRDGLYWERPDGSPGGPISKAIAQAISEGYSAEAGTGYHGYYFKVLEGQGPAAPFGEIDYVIDGIMIGGFGLLATPMEYGVSGIKTFIVSHDGLVYEKDLGPSSLNAAKAINRFNPDDTWRRTDDHWPEGSD